MVLNKELCNIGIVGLYHRISELFYGKTFDSYDCTKVEVGEKIYEDVRNYYQDEGMSYQDFCMAWLCYGPKATLEGYEVRIQKGFVEE